MRNAAACRRSAPPRHWQKRPVSPSPIRNHLRCPRFRHRRRACRRCPETACATAGAQRCDVVNVTDGVSPPWGHHPLAGDNAAGSAPRKLNTIPGLVPVTASSVRSAMPAASTRTSRAACGVELLGIVNQQDADAGAFGGQQRGVDGERLKRGPDQVGGPHRRSSRLRRSRSHRRAQQHQLLVSAREPPRGGPFRTARQPAHPLELSQDRRPRSAQRVSSSRNSAAETVAVPRAARSSAGHSVDASRPSADLTGKQVRR